MSGPFDLDDSHAYAAWRQWKLSHVPADAEALRVDIACSRSPTGVELQAVERRLRHSNMAIYRFLDDDGRDRERLRQLAARFGLNRLDHHLCSDPSGITALRCDPTGKRERYIPYTDQPINWHTDGYYNHPEEWIRGMVLHCVRPAAEGGENFFMDPELLYIRLRDENPAWIRALMDDDMLCIPPNREEGGEQPRCGPVFSVDRNGCLHMRFTIRKRNVIWKDEPLHRQAREALMEQLQLKEIPVYHYRLNAGEGLICNNVLHGRTGFRDDAKAGRLMYRARYFDRHLPCGPGTGTSTGEAK